MFFDVRSLGARDFCVFFYVLTFSLFSSVERFFSDVAIKGNWRFRESHDPCIEWEVRSVLFHFLFITCDHFQSFSFQKPFFIARKERRRDVAEFHVVQFRELVVFVCLIPVSLFHFFVWTSEHFSKSSKYSIIEFFIFLCGHQIISPKPACHHQVFVFLCGHQINSPKPASYLNLMLVLENFFCRLYLYKFGFCVRTSEHFSFSFCCVDIRTFLPNH